jgi:predicted ATPase
MMAELSRQRLLTEMAIKPLSRQEIEALATSLLGCPLNPAVSSLLYAQSEGNPFFAEELLGDWIETGVLIQHHQQWVAVAPLEQTLPPSIVGALRQRFTRLSAESIDDLRVAAIIGRPFDPSLLATAQQQELEVIEEHLLGAAHARLVHGDGQGGFTFNHDKIRECLSAEVSASRRRRLHGLIGHLLEKHCGQEESMHQLSQLAELAFHFARSDDRERGADYSLRAASHALRTFAAEEALAHYRMALELLKPGDRHLPTIKQVPAGATFRMRELLIGGQGEALLDLSQIQQGIVFAAHHEANSCCGQIDDDGPIPIQAIKSNESLAWQQTQGGLIGNDHTESP